MTNKISNKTRQDLTIKYLIENICFTFIKYNCFLIPSLTQILFIIQAKLAVMIPNDLKVYPLISWMFCSFGDFSIFTPNFVLIFKHYTQLFSLCITMVTYNTESIKKQKKRADINAIYIIKCQIKIKDFTDIKIDPAGIYLLKVNNRNTRAKCEICSKFTKKTSE